MEQSNTKIKNIVICEQSVTGGNEFSDTYSAVVQYVTNGTIITEEMYWLSFIKN